MTVQLRRVVDSPVKKTRGQEAPFVALEHVESGTGRLLADWDSEPKESDDAADFEPGDVLFGKLRPYLHKVWMADRPGHCSTELVVMRPHADLVPRFLNYVALSSPFLLWADASSYGTKMPRTSWELLGQVELALPPAGAQQAIADFLDRQTERIDALVEKKRRLIELLEEKRTALISHVVTKGLDPTVPMKDSGISWLGEIPAHWEVSALKRAVPNVTVGIVIQPSRLYEESGVPCIRGFNVRPFDVTRNDLVFISDESNRAHAKSILSAGDLIVVRTGQAGAAAVVPRWADGANCVDVLIIRQSHEFVSELLAFFINSSAATGQVDHGAVGAIQSHFNVGTMREMHVPVPPLSEQKQMVDSLQETKSRIDELEAKIGNQLRLLAEYRQALITSAVTGEIDIDGTF